MDKYYWIKFLNLNNINTDIKYSEITGKWFVSTSAELKGNGILSGICYHGTTPDDAVDGFNNEIKGHTLVIRAYGKDRMEINIP